MQTNRLRMIVPLALASAFVASGCLGVVENYYSFDMDSGYVNPGVFPGNYNMGNDGSTVLKGGPLRVPKNAEVVHLVSERPHFPVPEGLSNEGKVLITLAYWLPVGVTGPVPVIVDAGPYFEQDGMTIDMAQQSIPFLVRNFVPHGYAVAAVAIRGTGTSGGCMELMGPNEVADLSQAITWLGTQPWSNGNVAMYGASYDGSTSWMVASTGNPHLKTFVPTSGLPDIFDLMFRNGTSETRGPIMHNVVYWPFGWSGDFLPVGSATGGPAGRQAYQNRQNLLCPEAFEGAVMGPYAATQGERGSFSTYWQERNHRPGVLKNYKGSIFMVHGLQDWNVDPHVAIPFMAELRANGIETKEWYGQWAHAYPDSECAKNVPKWLTAPCRFDYAEVLYRWFEYYLKDNKTVDLGPAIQIQDNRGYWRNSATYPPVDADWQNLALTPEKQLVLGKPSTSAALTLLPPAGPLATRPAHLLEFKTEPLAEDLRIAGLPQLHVEFEAQGPGGFLGAWLFDENAGGKVLDKRWFMKPSGEPVVVRNQVPVIGHAQMDLRYYDGGETQQRLVPGQRYVAKMEFEPMDVLVPKGHRLTLWLFQYQYPDKFGGIVPSPVKVFLGDSKTTFRIPTVQVDETELFPVPGAHFPDRKYFEVQHVAKPVYSETIPPINERMEQRAQCLDAWRALGPVLGYRAYLSGDVPAACRPSE